jgi:predicted O-linked N-acetylglucosamine transferase (SPINDLY family)
LTAEELKNLGNARRAAGDLAAAAESYRRALAISPDYVPALYNLGLVLRQSSRTGEAERCFRRVAELAPADADALFHLGSIADEQGRSAEAAAVFRRALAVAPDHPFLWLHLGIACRKLGDLDAAAAAYRRALELRPDDAEAHSNFGNLLQEEGRAEEAIAHYREAVRVEPGFALAWNNLGSALVRTRDLEAAARSLARAVELQPDFADAQFNLGNVHSLSGERDRAVRCFTAAHERRPEHPAYSGSLLLEMQQICDWSRFDELCERQRRAPLERPDEPISPFGLLSIPSTRAEQLQCARNYATAVSRRVERDRRRLDFRFACGPRERLRIGYLSADFHEHATAHWTAELFELHDRSRFEVIAYSYGPDDGSAMRARLKRAFDGFVDVMPMSYADAAAAIHADGVDILVELKGYTQHARTEIAAMRPAPIQVSFVGYPATMGADFIDYLVADRWVAPPEHAADYSEKLVYMPGSYQVNDRKRAVAERPPRARLGLPEHAFVFCSFNQTYKILPEAFAVWMRLLAQRPDSVLWLLETNPWATQNLRREAESRGVDAARLLFAPVLPHAEHLARMGAADLLLDTWPYNAHTISSDALWVGLPVLTWPGETFAARVAAGQLSALGVPELIAGSRAQYEALALELARSPGKLASVRRKVLAQRDKGLLFDTSGFTRHLEAAYEEMWRVYAAGEPLRAIAG